MLCLKEKGILKKNNQLVEKEPKTGQLALAAQSSMQLKLFKKIDAVKKMNLKIRAKLLLN